MGRRILTLVTQRPSTGTTPIADWGDAQVRLTDTVSVLVGPGNGMYPSGNSVLIEGAAETALIDPSVTVVANGGAPVPVDAVINSHGHEDHLSLIHI